MESGLSACPLPTRPGRSPSFSAPRTRRKKTPARPCSGLRRRPLARRPLLGSFLRLLGVFDFAGRPFLFLVRHDALPRKFAQANMLRTGADSTWNLRPSLYWRFDHRLAVTPASAEPAMLASCPVSSGLGQV